MFWHATWQIARKEFLQLLRTKRLIGVGIAMVATMALLTFVVPFAFLDLVDLLEQLAGDQIASAGASQNFVLLFFLSGVFILSGYFVIQLLPILLTADAVCSEWQNRSIFLVLSKPVPRPAFVLGKFLGIALPVAAFTTVLLLVDYLLLIPLAPGTPGLDDWGRFMGGLGIIVLGVLAFSAIALFFSTLMRSSVASLLLAIVAPMMVFPLLGNIQFFIDLGQDGVGAFAYEGTRWSEFLNPAHLMESAGMVMLPEDSPYLVFVGGLGGGAPPWWASCIGLVVHTAVFLGASLLLVQRRNFE